MAAVAGGLRGRLALAAIFALAALVTTAAQAPKPREYEVKAAYLYGFGRFVEWPSAAMSGANFVVCVLGEDPFGRALDDATSGATMKDRPVVVRRLMRVEDAEGCHTLFVSASEDVRLARILQATAGRPILTVGESPQFVQRGGMVGFFTDGARIRFNVNLQVAQASGLILQSELLRVAATVLRVR